MIIRTATHEDLDAIVEIYNQAIIAGQQTADTETFSAKDRVSWFKSHKTEQHPVYVALHNKIIIGYLSLGEYRYGRPALMKTAEISYYIHLQHHGKGIATALLRHAISCCPSLRIETLIAVLLGCNKRSIQFLKKNRFVQWGCMPDIAEIEGEKYDHLYYGLHIDKLTHREI